MTDQSVPEFIEMPWRGPDILIIGETYAVREYVYRPGTVAGNVFIPITITGKARRGTYGERVTCSDNINRYQSGDYRGKHRPESYSRTITHKRNPAFTSSIPALVQLEFDF